MPFKTKIQEDLKKALQEGDAVKVSTLRMFLAAIVNKEKEKGQEVNDEMIQDIASSEAKKRRESIQAFEQGGRPELAAKEQQELEVLLSYLPEQLSDEEIRELAKEAIQQTGAGDVKDMGKVMAQLGPKVKGRADGAKVASIVKELLS